MTWLAAHWSAWLTIFLFCLTVALMSRQGRMRKMMSYHVTNEVCLLDFVLGGAFLSAILFWIASVGKLIQLLS